MTLVQRSNALFLDFYYSHTDWTKLQTKPYYNFKKIVATASDLVVDAIFTIWICSLSFRFYFFFIQNVHMKYIGNILYSLRFVSSKKPTEKKQINK